MSNNQGERQMEKTVSEAELRAFAIGYHDGYVHGYVPGDELPYDDTPLRGFYKRGYDAGIADYCEQTLDKEQEA